MVLFPLGSIQGLIVISGILTMLGAGLLVRSIFQSGRTVPPQGTQTTIDLSPPPWFVLNQPFHSWITRVGLVQFDHPVEYLPITWLRLVGWSSGIWAGAVVVSDCLGHPDTTAASSFGVLMVGLATGVGTGLVRSLIWLAARKPAVEFWFEVILPTAATVAGATVLWGVLLLLLRWPTGAWLLSLAGAYIALGNGGAVASLLGDRRWPLVPRQFRCERCQTPVIALSAGEVTSLLTPAETLALPFCYLHRPVLQVKGWRCPTCHPNLSRDTCYLLIYQQESVRCPQCQQPTYLNREDKVELGKACLHCGHETPGPEVIDVATARRRIQQDSLIQAELENIRILQELQQQVQAQPTDAKPVGDRDDNCEVNLGTLIDFPHANDSEG